MSDIIVRPLDIIAAEINQIKRTTAKYVLEQSIEIGRLLVEAKQSVAFGEWGGWLEANFEYSVSTANNLMRIYNEYGEEAQLSFFEENKLELYGNLNRSQAVALLSLPKREREEFVRTTDVASLSVSELEEKIKAAKEEARAEAEDRIRVAESTAKKEAAKAAKEAKSAQDKLDNIRKENETLQIKLSEAEQKPVEVPKELRDELERKAREEVEQDMVFLREQNEKLKRAADPYVQEFGVHFKSVQETLSKMFDILDRVDEMTREKLTSAIKKLIDSVGEKMR